MSDTQPGDTQPGDAEPETFHLPLPPPFPPGAHGDVLYVRGAPEDVQSGRAHEDIMLRRVPRDVAMRFRAAAGGRGLTHAQYLAALVELHAALRSRAEGGDEAARTVLDGLGLASVTV
jgi:hypothetical protein